MGAESPNVILYDVNGQEMSVSNGVAIPAGTSALMIAGSDGTNSRFITLDGSGRTVAVGAGVAGTPAGGVISIQGVASGTVVPVSGTVNLGTTQSDRTTIAQSLNMTATTNNVALTAPGTGTAAVQITGATWTGTIIFEATVDGANWFTVNAVVPITGAIITTTTANGQWLVPCAGYAQIRLRCSVTGTNSATVSIEASAGTQVITLSNSLPTGSNTIGAVTGSGNFTVVQATAANLNATVTGTVTANIGTTNGLALDTTVSGLQVSQGSTTSGQKGGLTLGAVTTSAPSYTTAQTSPLSLTTAGALRIDGSAVTQPVSGTVTANIGTTNGLALDTSVNGILVSQGSTTSGEKGPLIQGAVTTSAPSYTTAQTSPLSLTTAGALRIDGSAVTQPVSGTVTSNQGTANTLANAWSIKITDATNGPAAVKAASTAAAATDPALVVAISPNNSVNAFASDATATGNLNALNAAVQLAVQGENAAGMQLSAGTLVGTIVPEISIDGGTTWVSSFFDDPATGNKVTSIVFGSSNTATTRSIIGAGGVSHVRIRVSAFTSGTASCSVRASIMQDVTLVSEGAAGAALPPTMIQVGGSVTTSAPSYSNNTVNALSLNTSGGLRVDGSGVTQPVSGTVTANQGTANTLANAWSTKITDTTNGPAAVKAASTAAVAADQALVVAISPNNSIGVTVSSGAADTTATGSLGALNATVQVSLSGLQGAGMQLVAGTLVGTIVPEVSLDGGTTWVSNFFADPATGNIVSSIVFGASNAATTRTIVAADGVSHVRVRVSAYTSGSATCNLRASMSEEPVILSTGQTGISTIPPASTLVSNLSYGVTRNPRVDRFNHVRNAIDNLLFFDPIDDKLSSSINPLIWSTNLSTMTVNQSSNINAGITLNNGALTTASAFAIISSNRRFQIMNHGPIKISFRAQFVQGSTNSVLELGLGLPTNGRLQPQLVDGAFFRFSSSQVSSAIFTTASVDQSATISPTLSTSQYYNFIIYIDETSAQFIVESTPGIPIFSTSFTVPVGDGAQFLTNHLPIFARVYNLSSAPASAPQILIRQVTVLGMDLATNKLWEHQLAGAGRSSTFDPQAFTSTSNLAAGAAPAAGTPSNTAALFTTLGGEYICNATATSENLLSIFAYIIPNGYAFYLTDIFIHPPIVAGAATATTATNIQFGVVVNCTSTNISTGGGQLFTIPGAFVAPTATAIGASFSGNTCAFTPKTPIVCNSGSILHIAYKIYLGTATASSKYRGSVTVVGYFE